MAEDRIKPSGEAFIVVERRRSSIRVNYNIGVSYIFAENFLTAATKLGRVENMNTNQNKKQISAYASEGT